MKALWMTMMGASLAASPALAQQAEPTLPAGAKNFAVEGAGRLSCATFKKARSDKSSAEYQRLIGFVEGYLSAANRYESNTFDLTPWHNALAFDIIIDGYCGKNLKEPLVNVVQRMVTGFRNIRVAQFSPMIEVGDGTHKAYVYQTILQRSQAELKRRGLYSGAQDGRFSPQVKQAFASFQKSKKLDPTGIPDPATLWMLLNP